WRRRHAHRRSRQKRRSLRGVNPGHFDVEYFLSRRPRNHDAPCERARTRRVARRHGSLRSIAFVIGPFLFSWTFAWFIDPKHSFHVPAAGYYLAAALLFTAMLMATGIKQPDFSAAKSPLPDRVPDVVPPEGATSGNVAPLSGALGRDDV